MGILKVLLFGLLCVLPQIKMMSLEGTPQTRYDPCGLGVVYIDKIQTKNETIWQAVLNLNMYPDLKEADVKIIFEVPVNLVSLSHKTTMVDMNEYNWNFIISEDLPNQFTFNLKVKYNDTVPKVKLFSLNNQILCNEIEKASQTIDSLNLTKNDDSPQYSHVCGRRSMEHTELTTTGSASKRGDWPWHVAIFLHKDNTNLALYQCGGNIISRSTIITAGHCIFESGVQVATERVYIFAGTIDLKPIPDKDTQVRKAQKIIIHPSYNKGDATADLAIIKIDDLSFTEYVQPICMWGDMSFEKSSLFGMSATFAGFGVTENKTFSYELRSSRLEIQNDATCISFSPKLYQSLLNEFTFCAGYGPHNATIPRNGDSGGGLILPRLQGDHKMSWFLRGILSKCGVMPGESVCDIRHYVVYTDIGPHYMWIMYHSQLKYRGL